MIWCVEDDSSIRDIEVYALSSTGFEARGFADGDSFWHGLLVKLAYVVVPQVDAPQKTELLDERLLATPAVAVQRAHEIAGEMAADAAKAMHLATLSSNP